MHALHRPDLRLLATVTALAAALAIIVTLLFATGLSDLTSSSASASGRTAAARATPTVLTRSSLTVPLGRRIRSPWPSTEPSALPAP
jgi:hypothetical protein